MNHAPHTALNPLMAGTLQALPPSPPVCSPEPTSAISSETDPMQALWRIKDERSVRFGNARTLLQHLRQTRPSVVAKP